jgi:hypothetical protein
MYVDQDILFEDLEESEIYQAQIADLELRLEKKSFKILDLETELAYYKSMTQCLQNQVFQSYSLSTINFN